VLLCFVQSPRRVTGSRPVIQALTVCAYSLSGTLLVIGLY
jgi:hypothetical protein